MQESLDLQALAEESRLGELLISVGLLHRSQLEEALQIVEQTGLGIGRVLVLSQHINEKTLDAAVQCQSMLRSNRMDLNTVKQTLGGVASGRYKSFDDAMGSLGQATEEPENKLGDLLVDGGLLSRAQLTSALSQSEETGLPFGRLLVLGGILSEQTMTSALNAQSMLVAGRISRDEALRSLKSSVRRTVTPQTNVAEKDFYQLPDRRSVLLGELLVAAESITKPQLSNAIELSVSSAKSLGQVLSEQKQISDTVLRHALEMQEMVMSNKCSPADAAKIISLIDHDKLPMEVAQQRVRLTAQLGTANKKVTFIEFLKLLGVADDDAVNKALSMGRDNAQLMMQMLMFAKVCDPNFLHLAASCNAMMESGRLSTEHAFVLFDYACKKRINIEQALKELNWGQGDIANTIQTANAGTEWEVLKKQAEHMLQDGDLIETERIWIEVVKKAEVLGGREGPRYVGSLERLADVYVKQGKMAQAESLYSEALVTKTKVLPPHSLHTASSVNNMAKISYFQGKYEESERFALRFLELYKANFPHNHPDVACALQNVATLYHMQEKFHLAEPYYTEAIRICNTALGDQHPTTVRMNQNYARLLQQMKRYKEADKVDARVQGSVTGSWKAVAVPADHTLYSLGDKED